jgi:predicted nucleic acid-binding protein
MQIIINDTCCLIDLRKAGLLHASLLLPFVFQIADTLVDSEFLDFTKAEIEDLIARGLSVVELPSEGLGRALTYRSAYPNLSFNDCASMALAASQAGSILLTGDQNLRKRACDMGIEVHGVLWMCDQLQANDKVTYQSLLEGLVTLQNDPLVFVPADELELRIARLVLLM